MLSGSLWGTMALCLALTILIECALALLLGVRSRHGLMIVLMVNVMTNPLVVSLNCFLTQKYGMAGYYGSLVVLEAAAFLAEAMIYRRDPPCSRNPFLLSALLNGCSFLAGVALNFLF